MLISLLALCLLALNQLLETVWQRLRRRDARPSGSTPALGEQLPLVTVQLPVRDEYYVIERLIDSCCALDFPRGRLEIQVLDDSGDETTTLIAAKVSEHAARGVDIRHLRRPDRAGFKAGNLQHGLATARGEFVAIFDADCVPDPGFLRRTLPYFRDPGVGIVFARYVRHLNRGHSLLTLAQDPHGVPSVVPQVFYTGHHFNFFFGSPGLLRRACIDDVGGWQGDTLCEDEDFSIRAYLRGWRCVLLEERLASDEVAVRMQEVKQQFTRWKKGNAECYRKHLAALLTDRSLKPAQKLAVVCAIHVPWAHIPLVTLLTLGSPLLLFGGDDGVVQAALRALPSLFAVGWFVAVALLRRPAFVPSLLLNLGLFPRTSWGIVLGLLGVKTPFQRSAKLATAARAGRRPDLYPLRPTASIAVEGALALLFLWAVAQGLASGMHWLVPFHLLFVASFGFVFVASVAESYPRGVAAGLAGRAPTGAS